MLRKVLGLLAQGLGHRRVNWVLKKINYILKRRVNGIRLSIPSIHGVTCGDSEPWMTDLLAVLLQEQSGAFFDVGVNVGQTLVKVKALDRSREYIGFEPNPVCISYVQELIKENKFENCTLLPVGLYTQDCVLSLDLFSDSAADSSASLIDNFRPDHKIHSQIFVPVFRFDSLAKHLSGKRVGIVKIDVEGAELEVMKSLLKLIGQDKPIILIEVLPVYSKENTFRKNRQDELEQIFGRMAYAIFRVEKSRTDTYLGLTQIEKIGIHSDLDRCDYVLIPNERFACLQTALDMPVGKDMREL